MQLLRMKPHNDNDKIYEVPKAESLFSYAY